MTVAKTTATETVNKIQNHNLHISHKNKKKWIMNNEKNG